MAASPDHRWVLYCMGCGWATNEITSHLGLRIWAHATEQCSGRCIAVFRKGAEPPEVRMALGEPVGTARKEQR